MLRDAPTPKSLVLPLLFSEKSCRPGKRSGPIMHSSSEVAAAMLRLFVLISLLSIQALATVSDDDAKVKSLAEIEEKSGKAIEKFSVKELRELLRERGVQCAGTSLCATALLLYTMFRISI